MVTQVTRRRALRRRLLRQQAQRRAQRLHARATATSEEPRSLLGDRLAARPCAIHVARLGQGQSVWQPVAADYLGGDRYRIVETAGGDGSSRLQFEVGQIVRCELSPPADGERLLAVSLA